GPTSAPSLSHTPHSRKAHPDGSRPQDVAVSTSTDLRILDAPADHTDDENLVVARKWHPWRWVISAAVLILVAQFVHGLATNPGWDWSTFAQYFTASSVLSALWMTIELTLWGTALGFALGVLLAVGRLSN